MKEGEVNRYLRYLGHDTLASHQAETRHLKTKKRLVATAVLCALILTALVIHAARPGQSSMSAPEMDHISSMDEPGVVYQDASENTTYANQSALLLPRLPHPECYGRWYPLVAGIKEGLLAVPAK